MRRRKLGMLLGVAAIVITAFATPAGAAASVSPAMLHAGIPKQASLNWSGYAVSSSTTRFTYVHSRWVEPALTCPGVKNQDSSIWVGLDGAFDGTVEQDGTAADCKGPHHETPVYTAWIEMYPEPEVVAFQIAAGDVMDGVVSYANKTFTLTIADLTSGRSRTTVAQCAGCKRSSAEWIIERGALCKTVDPLSGCFIEALANFGSATMTQNTAQVAGGPVSGISAFNDRQRIVIVTPQDGGYVPLDDVSTLGGQSFTVTWLASGKPVPITL